MKPRLADVVFAIVLAVATILLYRKITRLFWTYDDAYLIHIAVVHPAHDHFVGGSIWRSMPQQLFTPLLTATYDAELSLFGLDARAFYIVHLLLLVTLSITIFATARLWLPPETAAFGVLLFMAGVPMCAIASELMLVHYVESLILGCAALALFVIAERRNSIAPAIASAALYLIAMLAKEIAVPLIAVFFFRDRRRSVPHIVALALYAIWRRTALGVWFGGYGWAVRMADVPSTLAAFPRALFRDLTGPSIAAGVALLVVIAIGIACWAYTRRRAVIVITLILLSVAPTLPMARKFESRYAVLLWLVCAMFAAAGFEDMFDVRVSNALMAVGLILIIVVNRQEWRPQYAQLRRMSGEARGFLDLRFGDALRKPAVPPAAMSELAWVKDLYMRRPSGAIWFYDDLFLCDARNLPRRVVQYDEKVRSVVDRTDVDEIRKRYCNSIRANVPLSANFEHRGNVLYWTFGPYDRGAYAIVFADGISAYELQRRDGFRLPGVQKLNLRVRYTAPEGWVTYSPELSLDFTRASNFEWHR